MHHLGDEIGSKALPHDSPEHTISLTIKEILTNLVAEGDFAIEHLIYAFALFERYLFITKLHGDIDLEKIFSTASFVAHKFLEEKENWFFPEFGKLTGLSD